MNSMNFEIGTATLIKYPKRINFTRRFTAFATKYRQAFEAMARMGKMF